jgi:hydroxymethylglutaryl-CoA lyase
MTTATNPNGTALDWRKSAEAGESVLISETFLRDGAQAMPESALAYLTVGRKLEIIRTLCEIGMPGVEVASFAHPRVLPQFVDAEDILRGLPTGFDTEFRAVTPNLRGLVRAAGAGAAGRVKMIGMIACSEEYQRRNVQKSISEGLVELEKMVAFAESEGITLLGGAGLAFGCPYEGAIDPARVYSIVADLVQMGITEIWVGDTYGMASPTAIFDISSELLRQFPGVKFGLHLHNRHGLAIANVLAALEAGIRRFDTSMLGVGAGSVIPGNRTEMGNVATEEVVGLCQGLGFDTGVDISAIIALALELSDKTGIAARSRVLNVGIAI